MKIHFIAIGGSAMHNLAIALHKKGYQITGSDDEIFEPSKSRLARYGLLPQNQGWDAANIHSGLDAVILGMHAKADNPELLEAKRLNLNIFSYPEFLYQQSRNKTRIVIGGSHGKTTITSMILHVMQFHNIDTDYMVGAQLEGFEVMVKLSENAPFIVLEGDEYLSSPIDHRPKFHLYKPHIALLSGIAWDHINVFPTFEDYLLQFSKFIDVIESKGKLIYCAADEELKKLCEDEKIRKDLLLLPYSLPDYEIRNGKTLIKNRDGEFPLQVFGKHNLLNIAGAMIVCRQAGISEKMFLQAISSFKGASNRLELLSETDYAVAYKDFAHAPSKLKATTAAIREQYPDKKFIAFMELHTYSSLNKEFLIQYKDSMNAADQAYVFYSPHALQLKRLPDISPDQVKESFGRDDLVVLNDVNELNHLIAGMKKENSVYLFMSSGNFGGLNIKETASFLTNNKQSE
jgi:UDP-N-acetylmuramate: L-alanyl-gamma-D-glutamyl-meso-diaminopimelate ligase